MVVLVALPLVPFVLPPLAVVRLGAGRDEDRRCSDRGRHNYPPIQSGHCSLPFAFFPHRNDYEPDCDRTVRKYGWTMKSLRRGGSAL
jgi:hypothetical protein